MATPEGPTYPLRQELAVHRNYIISYPMLAERRPVEILRVKHAPQQAVKTSN
jgi:plasmid stabilization system protein ParE